MNSRIPISDIEYIIPKYISKGKSCLILTDSKEVTDKLKLIFQKHNSMSLIKNPLITTRLFSAFFYIK